MEYLTIEKIIQENRPFHFTDYISKGFDLFSKNVGNFVAFSMLSVLIMSMVGSLPIIGKWSMQYLVVPALTAGFYLVAHQIDRGKRSEFSDHFNGFQHLTQLGLAAIGIIFYKKIQKTNPPK